MAIKPDDQEIGTLYREAGGDGPSADLDQAILQAARDAVAAPAAPAAGWRRWRLHIPVFASLFMVALFGLLISLQQPDAPGIGQIALNETAPAAPAPASAPERAAPLMPESRARMAEAAPPHATAKMTGPAQEVEMARPAAPTITASAPAENRMSATADAAAPVMEKSEASAPVAARAAARQAATAPAAAPVQPASEWLAAIQRLLDQDRIAEAKTSLEAFQKVYPAVTIPAAMRQRLQP